MSEIPHTATVITDHRRQWRDMTFVYPVISRRSRGLSIGINLNTDKRCNFACRYCQINRRLHRLSMDVDLVKLREELSAVLKEVASGDIWRHDRFEMTPPELRRLNDIAFSGDGEPTCLPNFDAAVRTAAEVLHETGLGEPCKIVIITNGTQLTSGQVLRALPILDAHHGEWWIKLDAGTEEFFHKINRPSPNFSLDMILKGMLAISHDRPIVIQSLFCLMDSQPPSELEIDSYIAQIHWLLEKGGHIKFIQVHTVARPPAESNVETMPDEQLDELADKLRTALPEIDVHVFYGRKVDPQV